MTGPGRPDRSRLAGERAAYGSQVFSQLVFATMAWWGIHGRGLGARSGGLDGRSARSDVMKVAIAADHAGVALRKDLEAVIRAQGHDAIVLGADLNDPSDDYPTFAKLVGGAIASGRASRAILICGSGAGVTVAANKLPAVRAALAADDYTARQMVEHDLCNVMTLGARTLAIETARDLVKSFLAAEFLPEPRHRRRLAQVLRLEWDQHPSPLRDLHEAGQSVWLDSIRRSLLTSATLARYISQLCVTGLTSNPTIFDRAIAESDDYDRAILELRDRGFDNEEIFSRVTLDDVVAAADLFRPVYEASSGSDGFVSLEVSPTLADDAKATVVEARRLHELADRPNLYIKVPGTAAGIVAIEELIAAGVPINVTLLFSCEQYLAAADAYMRGLERRIAAGASADVSSVASLFVSRWDVASAPKLPARWANTLGIAVAHQSFAAYRGSLESERWRRLAAAGATPQRLLFGSTGTKDPALPDTYYLGALAAAETIDTMPEASLLAFADHGKLAAVLTSDTRHADAAVHAAEAAGIDVQALATDLQRRGVEAFADSFHQALRTIETKIDTLRGAPRSATSSSNRTEGT